MSKTRDEALQYNVSGHEFIRSLLSGTQFPSGPRNDLVYAYVALVLEHQNAIVNLIRLNLVGSAFALLRPQVETAFRGLWTNLIASDEQVTAIGQRGEEPFPPFRKMAEELDTRYRADGWLLGFADDWKTLNGFTHTGLEQLGRRFQSDGNIAPNYEEMVPELATYSGTLSIGIVVPILRTIHFEDKAKALEGWLAQTRAD
jgi:hypothetical protein